MGADLGHLDEEALDPLLALGAHRRRPGLRSLFPRSQIEPKRGPKSRVAIKETNEFMNFLKSNLFAKMFVFCL